MPGSVSNAAPTRVLPWSLCKAFARSQEYAVLVNKYKNGESQRGLQVDTSRKTWKTTRRLTPAELQLFRDFYDAGNGSQEPLFFYDFNETYPKYSYDPTGSSVYGRHIVRFEGDWEQRVDMARGEVDIALVELA